MAMPGEVYAWTDSHGNYYEFELVAIDLNWIPTPLWSVKCVRTTFQAGALSYSIGDTAYMHQVDLGTRYTKVSAPMANVPAPTVPPRTAPQPGKTTATGVQTSGNAGSITFTFGAPLTEIKRTKDCKCDPDHPHNERGCYFGMCGCRVAK